MKLILLAAVGAIVLAFAAAANAASPSGFTAAPLAPLAVTQLTASQAKTLGVPDAFLPGTKSVVAAPLAGAIASPTAAGPCGACINTCWVADHFHAGSDTATGSYWENASPVWCGNGSWITYVDTSRHWQSTSIWYSPEGEAGPWTDGGCLGCGSIHFTIYGNFAWHPPFGYVSYTTARLGVWLEAYGSAAYG
jgi:hypothetical protein